MSKDPIEAPEPHLAALGPRFLRALALRESGKTDAAFELLSEILLIEPRLPEPRIERARIHAERGQLEDAEVDLREAIRLLEGGGQWTEDVAENVMQAIAWAGLGEVLKARASSDDVVFGDEGVFRELLAQSKLAFAKAAALDPTDAESELAALQLSEEAEDRALAKAELTGDFLQDLLPDEMPERPRPPEYEEG